jgi:hypothetical protein
MDFAECFQRDPEICGGETMLKRDTRNIADGPGESVFGRLDELVRPDAKPESVTLLSAQMYHRTRRTSAREMMDQTDKVLAMPP